MWITSITINNFRCFEALSLRPTRGLNTLVGENSAGKSTLFTALTKLLQEAQDQGNVLARSDFRFGEMSRPLLIKCEFGLDERDQDKLIRALSNDPLPQSVVTELRDRLASELRDGELTVEWSETSKRMYIRLGPMYIVRNWVSRTADLPGGSSGRLGELIQNISSSEETLEELLHRHGSWESLHAQERVGRIFFEQFRSFADFRARPSACRRTAALESFQGTDIASVLLNLKSHYEPDQRNKYRMVGSEFSRFFSALSIEAVEVNRGGETLADIQFLEKGRGYPVTLDSIGAGVAEILTLTTNLVAREGCILVVEEPELHLHPHAKRRLNSLIRNWTANNQIFVVTHDPSFVDPYHLDGFARFWTSPLGNHEVSLLADLSNKEIGQLRTAMKDVGKREMLFARALLLVEDESHKNAICGFSETLNRDLDGSGVSVVHVDSHDGFPPYITLANSLNIPYVCLRDKDWNNPEQFPPDKFRALGCELEDFFEQHGLGSLLTEAKRSTGNSKQRWARYVGEHAPANQIPSLFSTLIDDIIKVAERTSAYREGTALDMPPTE